MGSRVKYRDLPGGPAELTFCDELTRQSLCTNCNMLSMSMLQDTNGHMFCETCLTETSEKHHREHIHCKYENKQVSIFEMFDAHALITVIRDQYVMCPYQDCKSVVTLVQLKDHYMACHPTVTCSTCKQQVQTAEWSNHSKDCRERGAYKTSPKAAIPKQGNHNGASQRKDALLSPHSTQSARMDGYQNNGGTFRPMYPSSELQQAQKPTDDGSDKIMRCQHCEKKVKERNMPQHLDKCLKAPQLCAYCEKEFSKEKIKSHLAVCTANPGNVPEQPQERNREAPNQNVARPSEAHCSQPDSYAAALKGGKRVGGNISHSTTSRSGGTQQKAPRQVGPASAKGASKSCPVSKQAGVPADSPNKMSYSSARTTHPKSKCTCTTTRALDESRTTKSQGAKNWSTYFQNKRSYSPTTTTHIRSKGMCSPARALKESTTMKFQAAKDKCSYSTTRTTHSQNKWSYPSAAAVDESETMKPQVENAATPHVSLHNNGIPVLPALGVSHRDILAWFRKVESYFNISGICENRQKYLMTARSLAPQVQEVVEDILTSPPRTHAYECLFISLFRRNMSAVKHRRSEPIHFHTFVQQLPFELRVKFEFHCSETMALSACLHR